ncbi:MAG: hypothetical protein HC898_12420 [Phycisphaerales bacterium]|nr:hypothetical protein [Phycisphaerales bacterium]
MTIDAPTLPPDDDDAGQTVTWQAKRGWVFKCIVWTILVGFAASVLAGVMLLLHQIRQ